MHRTTPRIGGTVVVVGCVLRIEIDSNLARRVPDGSGTDLLLLFSVLPLGFSSC